MKLSELMAGKTPSASYEGFADNDDFVLAIDTAADATATPTTSDGDFAVVQVGATKAEASADAETKDNTYIRTGKMTTKTGAQRKFSIEGNRYVGDAFQDFCLSNAVIFGVGSAVVRRYIYFNILTGKGERGSVTIVVSDTQTGDAGTSASFKAELTSTATPADYTYGASNPKITQQPAGVSVVIGAKATFSVTANVDDGGTLSYQWQKSTDGTTFNNISGATSASYQTATTVSGDNGGIYRVIVINTHTGFTAQTVSNSAVLTVTGS